jgi:hypothetical protein
LGYQPPFLGKNGTEFEDVVFERHMNSLHPVKYQNDAAVNSTWSSLTWAESVVKNDLKMPKKDKYWMLHPSDVLSVNSGVIKANDYTEDEDVSSTLDSIKDAEHLMGFRGPLPTN